MGMLFVVKKSLLLHRKCKSEQKELVLLQNQFNDIDESLRTVKDVFNNQRFYYV
uniref:Vps5 domain-containing protein n=1 Tax=Heterorhabditis bacteriophora TaxID=37862 RepID=A0A1I7XBV8_HETBA